MLQRIPVDEWTWTTRWPLTHITRLSKVLQDLMKSGSIRPIFSTASGIRMPLLYMVDVGRKHRSIFYHSWPQFSGYLMIIGLLLGQFVVVVLSRLGKIVGGGQLLSRAAVNLINTRFILLPLRSQCSSSWLKIFVQLSHRSRRPRKLPRILWRSSHPSSSSFQAAAWRSIHVVEPTFLAYPSCV